MIGQRALHRPLNNRRTCASEQIRLTSSGRPLPERTKGRFHQPTTFRLPVDRACRTTAVQSNSNWSSSPPPYARSGPLWIVTEDLDEPRPRKSVGADSNQAGHLHFSSSGTEPLIYRIRHSTTCTIPPRRSDLTPRLDLVKGYPLQDTSSIRHLTEAHKAPVTRRRHHRNLRQLHPSLLSALKILHQCHTTTFLQMPLTLAAKRTGQSPPHRGSRSSSNRIRN